MTIEYREAERWVTPQGDLTIVAEHDIDRLRGEIILEITTFHLLMEAAGYIRTDNLHPDQARHP